MLFPLVKFSSSWFRFFPPFSLKCNYTIRENAEQDPLRCPTDSPLKSETTHYGPPGSIKRPGGTIATSARSALTRNSPSFFFKSARKIPKILTYSTRERKSWIPAIASMSEARVFYACSGEERKYYDPAFLIEATISSNAFSPASRLKPRVVISSLERSVLIQRPRK